MHYDVTSCVICISSNVEYLEKEGSYKNSAKEVALLSSQCNHKKFGQISLHTGTLR